MTHTLTPAQKEELISLYKSCRNANPNIYLNRAMASVTNQLVKLGYAESFPSNTGKLKYRVTERGAEAARLIGGLE